MTARIVLPPGGGLRAPDLAHGQELAMLVVPLPQDRGPVAEAPPAPPPPDPPPVDPKPDPAAEIFRITGKWIWDLGTPL